MSGDPAVEAAQRVWEMRYENRRTLTFSGHDVGMALTDAAREALAPLRDLHKPETEIEYDGAVSDPWCPSCAVEFYGDLMYQPWPCATARLVYSEEELDV